MITRRQTLFGGALCIAWGAGACGCAAQPVATASGFGCMLDDDAADTILAATAPGFTPTSVFANGRGPTLVSSGRPEFDYALAQTLSHLTDTFDVLPGFAYFDDAVELNAYATRRQYLSRTDGTVLFGRRLLDALMSRREHPDVAVSAMCAHEFGHITQFKLGLERQLLNGQKTVKRVELHADFLAGYFAGRRKLQKPDFPAAVYATTQYSVGDHQVDHARHHGRPDERAAAIVKGFEAAYRDKRSPAEAIQLGLNYVLDI